MSMNNSIKSCLSKVSCMWAQTCLTVRKTLRLRQQLQLCSVSRYILWYCDMRDYNHHLLSDSVRLNIWFTESLLICVKAASHMLNQNFTAPPCLYFDVCQQSFPNVSVGKCFILKSVHLKCPACCLAHCSAHKTNPCLTQRLVDRKYIKETGVSTVFLYLVWTTHPCGCTGCSGQFSEDEHS